MPEVRRFNNFIDFYNYNIDFIESNRMFNIFLIRTINEVIQGKISPYQFFNIEDDGKNTQLIVLKIPNICLIYSSKYEEELIPILTKEIEFHRFLRYTFAGNKQIIESLLKYNNSEYSVQKHLVIYKCDEVSSDFRYSTGEMQLANNDEIETLIRFNISFKKEYNGEEENYERARDFIITSIKDKNLYIWKNQNQLCSIAQVIFKEENDCPEIGHVYTEPNLRKNGFAPSLVHKLTSYLLNTGNQKCMLYTDGTNAASNRAFIKIGFDKIGDYILCYKEK